MSEHAGMTMGARGRWAVLWLVLIATVAMASAQAQAATPISLGNVDGQAPNVAVEADGSGYLTWAEDQTLDVAHYCRVPVGGAACNATRDFNYAAGLATDEGIWPVILGASGPSIINDRAGTTTSGQGLTLGYFSGNFGTTFSPGSPLAGNTVGENAQDIQGAAIYAANNTVVPGSGRLVLTIGLLDGGRFQASDLGAASPTTSFPMAGVDNPGSATLAVQGNTLMAAYVVNGSAFSRTYDGSGDPNLASNWSPPLFITAVGNNRGSQLLSGPGGFTLAYTTSDLKVALRQFSGGAWGAPLEVTPALPANNGAFGAAESPAGIIHITYPADDNSLKYRYARSAANNDFTNPQTLVPAQADSNTLADPQLAVSSAGTGFATWYDPGAGADFIAKAIPIAPGEGPPDGGGGGGGTNDVTSPVGGGYEIAFSVPKGCVAAGASFKVSVTLKKIKKGGKGRLVLAKKKKTKLKIKQVDFLKGNTLVLKDKKKPFEATITAATSGTFEVSAKVKYTAKKPGKKAKKKKKTLKQTVTVC